jgi:putative transposase
MIDRAHPTLSVSRQCHLLEVSRASVYRRPAPVSADDLRLMELIDRQYLACPFYGSRRMAAWLATQGHTVNRKRVQRLMRLMGLVAIYQRPNTSKAAPEHTKYPYLLGGLTIDRANQVWCSDITNSAPRPGWSGVHIAGMLMRKEGNEESPALCCEGA